MDILSWPDARAAAHAAGLASLAGLATAGPVERVALAGAVGRTLAAPLTTVTDLPAFPSSTIDGYATRGAGPWRLAGRVLAGAIAPAIESGTAIEVATGAMVPAGTEQIIRLENATVAGELVDGTARPIPEWRTPGDEAHAGEELFPAGTLVTPAVLGLAAACGHDHLPVWPAPRASVVVFGDELLTSGPPGEGRVRDSLGPQLPPWLRLLGAAVDPAHGPVEDTLDAHVTSIDAALATSTVVCTTGGTMRGPVDHLHPALERLGATFVADGVGVRPGFPMLLAALPGGRFVAGLPGNPQSAIVALASLVQPLLLGLTGRARPALATVRLADDIPGRGSDTHLALVRVTPGDPDGRRVAHPLPHVASSMLRGLAHATGFAVIPPGGMGAAGDVVSYLPLPGQEAP